VGREVIVFSSDGCSGLVRFGHRTEKSVEELPRLTSTDSARLASQQIISNAYTIASSSSCTAFNTTLRVTIRTITRIKRLKNKEFPVYFMPNHRITVAHLSVSLQSSQRREETFIHELKLLTSPSQHSYITERHS